MINYDFKTIDKCKNTAGVNTNVNLLIICAVENI